MRPKYIAWCQCEDVITLSEISSSSATKSQPSRTLPNMYPTRTHTYFHNIQKKNGKHTLVIKNDHQDLDEDTSAKSEFNFPTEVEDLRFTLACQLNEHKHKRLRQLLNPFKLK
ncbi:hypothetical protein HRI_005251000 [Hibiscus trionum]|uniref:Uncharacterized protein n=1 Tax=Hibiscus trionum TaxID=183268 RepID=A0A9W7MS17_HIBTR|nr:hypothetical protein HRI_005251000 [Hibiscus trionum]